MSSTDFNPSSHRDPLSVSVREACRLIGVGNTTLWALIKDGRVRTTRIGRRRLVIYASLQELMTSSADGQP
jgi:excisionase family DNA binding protein